MPANKLGHVYGSNHLPIPLQITLPPRREGGGGVKSEEVVWQSSLVAQTPCPSQKVKASTAL